MGYLRSAGILEIKFKILEKLSSYGVFNIDLYNDNILY